MPDPGAGASDLCNDFPTWRPLLSHTKGVTWRDLRVGVVMADRAYWQHSRTGEVWAVETTDGRPTACVGPITPSDAVAALLPWLALSPTNICEVREEWALFFRREECPICAKVVLPGATHPSCSLNPPTVH